MARIVSLMAVRQGPTRQCRLAARPGTKSVVVRAPWYRDTLSGPGWRFDQLEV